MARDNKNTGKGMTSRTRATSRVDLVPNTGTGPFGSIGSPKGSRGLNSNPKSDGKGNYPTVEANYRKPGKPLAKKAASPATKRATSRVELNSATGKGLGPAPKGARGYSSNPKSAKKGDYPTVGPNMRKPGAKKKK